MAAAAAGGGSGRFLLDGKGAMPPASTALATTPVPGAPRPLGAITERTLRCHKSELICMCMAADGGLVTGSDDDVRVWSLATGGCRATLQGHCEFAGTLCQLTDGRNRVLSGGGTGRGPADSHAVLLHDLDAAHGGAVVPPMRRFRGHTDSVVTVLELPGGRFASVSEDETVRIWAIETGACLAKLRIDPNTRPEAPLALADKHTLVCGAWTGLSMWDLRTYDAIPPLTASSCAISLLRLHDGMIVSTHAGGAPRLWDVRSGEVVHGLPSLCHDVCLLAQLPSGHLATFSGEQTVRVWDVGGRHCIDVIPAPHATAMCVTADGGLAVGCADGTVLVLSFAWARRSAAVVGWVAARWAE